MSDEGMTIDIDDGDDGGGSTGGRSGSAELQRRAERAEAEAAAARREASRVRQLAAARSQLETAAVQLEGEGRALEIQYANFLEAGAIEQAAAVTRRMGEIEARRLKIDEQVASVERMPVSSGDPFEDHLSKFTPRTADWMRSHRDWVTDPRKSAKLTGAHHRAVADGMTPDTDEYFEHVERQIGLSKGGGSSNRSNGYGGGGQTVTLTKKEAAAATDGTLVWNSGPRKGQALGLEEYGRRKLAMQREGRYTRLD